MFTHPPLLLLLTATYIYASYEAHEEQRLYNLAMGAYYDEIEIEDMAWDEEKAVFHYPCPCGDRFEISRKQLANYEDIATCPSCSLIIRVIYDPVRESSVFALVEQMLIAACLSRPS